MEAGLPDSQFTEVVQKRCAGSRVQCSPGRRPPWIPGARKAPTPCACPSFHVVHQRPRIKQDNDRNSDSFRPHRLRHTTAFRTRCQGQALYLAFWPVAGGGILVDVATGAVAGTYVSAVAAGAGAASWVATTVGLAVGGAVEPLQHPRSTAPILCPGTSYNACPSAASIFDLRVRGL